MLLQLSVISLRLSKIKFIPKNKRKKIINKLPQTEFLCNIICTLKVSLMGLSS